MILYKINSSRYFSWNRISSDIWFEMKFILEQLFFFCEKNIFVSTCSLGSEKNKLFFLMLGFTMVRKAIRTFWAGLTKGRLVDISFGVHLDS